MAISIKHKFQSKKEDGDDEDLVKPSDWNDEHDLTLGQDKLLGRASPGTGAVEEITCTAFARSLLDDADAATARGTLGLGTSNSPQFAAVNIGHASDTRLTRSSAGVVAVDGTPLLRASQNLSDVANAVTARTNLKIVTLTQAQYDGLGSKDPDTLYFITDAGA